MSQNVAAWFKEIIRDKVRMRYQQKGAYLDGMFTTGDGGAGEVKYPVMGGTVLMYQLDGSIQEIDASKLSFDMLSVKIIDWEAAAYLPMPADERKMGPSGQEGIAKLMALAVRKKRDEVRFDALSAISGATSTLSDNPKTVETIGDGSARITLDDAIRVADSLRGAAVEDDIYWPMPWTWFSQLERYKEFATKDYQGDKELPFARMSNVNKRTYRGVHFIALPNEVFNYGTGKYGTGSGNDPFNENGYLDTFAWAKEAVGAEIEWNQENMDMTRMPQLKGSPTLCKVGLSGNAIGLLPEGVKRIRMKAINKSVDPN